MLRKKEGQEHQQNPKHGLCIPFAARWSEAGLRRRGVIDIPGGDNSVATWGQVPGGQSYGQVFTVPLAIVSSSITPSACRP